MSRIKVKVGDKVTLRNNSWTKEGVVYCVFDWGVKLQPIAAKDGKVWTYNFYNDEIIEINGVPV